MKFNFENLKKGAKKALNIGATTAIMATIPLADVEAQTKEKTVQQEQVPFLTRLKEYKVVPVGMTEEEFQNLTKEEMETLRDKYMALRKTITPEERDQKFEGREVRTLEEKIYGKKIKEEQAEVDTSLIPTFDFNEWFKEQIKLGKEGQEVEAPDGKKYLIKINPNLETPKKQSPKTKKMNSPGNPPKGSLVSNRESSESFVLLKEDE